MALVSSGAEGQLVLLHAYYGIAAAEGVADKEEHGWVKL